MCKRRVLIFAAMQLEGDAVARAMGMDRPRPGRPGGGGVAGVEVSIWLIGIGAKHLPAGDAGRQPELLVLAGLSGALDPTLKIGDVVIDGSAEQDHCVPRARRGCVSGCEGILASWTAKAALFARTGALAADMESHVVRQWAHERQIPFLTIRAISDRADQTLDPAATQWVDEWGRPRIGAILRSIARDPRRIGHLARLGWDSKHAARELGDAVKKTIIALAQCNL